MSERIRCFFIGHGDTPNSVYSVLFQTVKEHITHYGVNEFIVGHYGNFDYLAAQAVIEVKVRHPASNAREVVEYARNRVVVREL